MPKLNKTTAKKVLDAEGGGFAPVPPGIYEAKLRSVETAEGAKGTYWKWEFEIPEEAEEYAKRRFWLNTSLSEAALWKLNETFAAFGCTPDTDTDELCGQMVRLQISVGTIAQGQRAGEPNNNVDKVLPFEDEGGDEIDF